MAWWMAIPAIAKSGYDIWQNQRKQDDIDKQRKQLERQQSALGVTLRQRFYGPVKDAIARMFSGRMNRAGASIAASGLERTSAAADIRGSVEDSAAGQYSSAMGDMLGQELEMRQTMQGRIDDLTREKKTIQRQQTGEVLGLAGNIAVGAGEYFEKAAGAKNLAAAQAKVEEILSSGKTAKEQNAALLKDFQMFQKAPGGKELLQQAQLLTGKDKSELEKLREDRLRFELGQLKGEAAGVGGGPGLKNAAIPYEQYQPIGGRGVVRPQDLAVKTKLKELKMEGPVGELQKQVQRLTDKKGKEAAKAVKDWKDDYFAAAKAAVKVDAYGKTVPEARVAKKELQGLIRNMPAVVKKSIQAEITAAGIKTITQLDAFLAENYPGIPREAID